MVIQPQEMNVYAKDLYQMVDPNNNSISLKKINKIV
jgi:hypothetical protein